MKQEAEMIYHRVGESPWPSSIDQPHCKDRLCWRLTQIQEPQVLKTPGWWWQGLEALWVLTCGHICKVSALKAKLLRSLSLSLSSTNREVWFSNELSPQNLWCDASGHAIHGARPRVKTQGSKPFCVSEGKTPLSPWARRYLLAQTPQVQKALCWNSQQPSPEGRGSWNARMSWPNRERRGRASTTSTAPVPESCQTIPTLGHLSGCVRGTIFTRHFPPGWKQSSH